MTDYMCRKCDRNRGIAELRGRHYCIDCMIEMLDEAHETLEAIVDCYDSARSSEAAAADTMRSIAADCLGIGQ